MADASQPISIEHLIAHLRSDDPRLYEALIMISRGRGVRAPARVETADVADSIDEGALPLTSKGDLLTRDGKGLVRQGIENTREGYVSTIDPRSPTGWNWKEQIGGGGGVGPAGPAGPTGPPGGIPTLCEKRIMWVQPFGWVLNSSPTAGFTDYWGPGYSGVLSPVIAGIDDAGAIAYVELVDPDSSYGSTLRLTILAGHLHHFAGFWQIDTGMAFRTGRNISLKCKLAFEDGTDVRYTIAVCNGNIPAGNPTGWNGSFAAFRFHTDTTPPDTNYMLCTRGHYGGSWGTSLVDSGVPRDSNLHSFEITFDDSIPAIHFKIDGVECSGSPITSGLPDSGVNMLFWLSLYTLSTGAKTLRSGNLYMEADK